MHEHVKPKIYYDASCRICSAGADAFATETAFERHDVSSRDLPPGTSYDDAMRNMHVVEADGSVSRGIDAVIRVMDMHPALRYVAPVIRLPGVSAMFRVAYRIVATHRHLFGTTRSRT